MAPNTDGRQQSRAGYSLLRGERLSIGMKSSVPCMCSPLLVAIAMAIDNSSTSDTDSSWCHGRLFPRTAFCAFRAVLVPRPSGGLIVTLSLQFRLARRRHRLRLFIAPLCQRRRPPLARSPAEPKTYTPLPDFLFESLCVRFQVDNFYKVALGLEVLYWCKAETVVRVVRTR